MQTLHPLATETSAALKGIGQVAQQTQPQFGEMVAGMMAFKAVNFVISEAKEAMNAYAAELNAARDYLVKVAEGNLKLRDSLRELRFIRGEEGGGGSVPEEVLRHAARTGMKTDDAAKFLKAQADAEAALPEAQRPDRKVSAAIGEEVSRLAARADLPATEAGKITGMLGRFGRAGTVDDGLNTMGMVVDNIGKRSMVDFKQAMPAFFNNVSEMVGKDKPVENIEDAAAIWAGATTRFSSAHRTTTGIRQANKLLRRLDGPEGEALKEMGVTEGMGFEDAMRTVRPNVLGGQGDRFLKGKGFGDMTAIYSVVKIAEAWDSIQEGLDANAEARKTGAAGRAMRAGNEKFLTEDPAGLKRVATAQAEIGEHLAGKSGEFLGIARAGAEAELKGRGEISFDPKTPTFREWLADSTVHKWTPGGERGERIDRAVFDKTLAAGRKVGLDLEGERNLIPGSMPGHAQRGQVINEWMAEIAAKPGGVEALGSVFRSPELEQKLDKLIEVTQQAKDRPFGLPGPPPAPMPARPVRAGGAG